MQYIEINEIIKKAKSEHKTIEKVFCPYLGQNVWFTMKGFRHLIGSRRVGKRDRLEIIERMYAVKYLAEILSKSGTLQEYENIDTEYFGFIAIINNKKYKVIVLVDNKYYKFISVMPKYKTRAADCN